MSLRLEIAVSLFLKDDIPTNILDSFRYMLRIDNGSNTDGESPLNPSRIRRMSFWLMRTENFGAG